MVKKINVPALLTEQQRKKVVKEKKSSMLSQMVPDEMVPRNVLLTLRPLKLAYFW